MSFETMLGSLGADVQTVAGEDFVCQCGWRPAKSRTSLLEGIALDATAPARIQYLVHSITKHGDETRRERAERQENDAMTANHWRLMKRTHAPAPAIEGVMGAAGLSQNVALAGAAEFSDDSKLTALLTGDTGSGKSTAAVMWLRLLLAPPAVIVGHYVHVPTLLGMFDSVDEQRERIGEARRARALVLDDVGRETRSESTAGVIHQLLLYRHDNGLKTLLTSNYGEEVFFSRYDLGGALADRFKASGTVVNCGTESMRRKA